MITTFNNPNSIVLSFNESEMIRVKNVLPTTALSAQTAIGLGNSVYFPELDATFTSPRFNYPFPTSVRLVIKKQEMCKAA